MKKTLKTTISVFSTILLVVAIIMLVVATISRFMGNQKGIFGYSMHYVVSESMEPEIKVGDLVIAKRADIEDVEVGDFVVFVSPDPQLKGIKIIHSVVEIEEDEQGIKLTTSGIKEGLSPDEYPVREIIGVYYWKSSKLGSIINVFTDFRNIMLFIIILTAVIVIIKSSKSMIKTIKQIKQKQKDEGVK